MSSSESEDDSPVESESEEVEEQLTIGASPSPIKWKSFVTDICCHPSRDAVAMATVDGDVVLHSYALDAPGHELLSFSHHKHPCRRVRFHPDGTLMFTAAKDSSLCIVDINTGALVHEIQQAHECPIYSLCVIDDYLCATGDDDGHVKLWDYRRQQAIMESSDCDDYVSDMVIDSAKKTLLATSGDGTLTAFNVRKKSMELQSETFDDEFLSIAIMMRGRKAVVGGGDGSLSLFNWGEWGNLSDRFPCKRGQTIDCLAPITDHVLCTGSVDGKIRALNLFPNNYLGVIGSHDKFPIESLSCLIAQYTLDPKRAISPLSMRLTGVIEAAVNGGIAKYQEAFFTGRYAQEHPDQAVNIARLKALILNKVHILEGGLSLHGRLAPHDVLPLQRRLVDRFVLMKQSIREAASPNMAARIISDTSNASDLRRPSIINTPLPPVPGEKKPPSEPCSNRSSSSGSSLYGHLLPECSDDEGIYSRPKDDLQNGPSPGDRPLPSALRVVPLTHPTAASPPPLPTRPRSVNLTTPDQRMIGGEHQCRSTHRVQTHRRDHSDCSGCSTYASYAYPSSTPVAVSHTATTPVASVTRSGTSSPRLPSRRPHQLSESSTSEEGQVDASHGAWCGENGSDKAPPLPPRASERRATLADSLGWEETRPALPHRATRKMSSPTMIATSVEVPCPSGAQFSEPVAGAEPCRHTGNPGLELTLEPPPPPPLPCKRSASIKSSDSIPGTPTHAVPLHADSSAQVPPMVVDLDLQI